MRYFKDLDGKVFAIESDGSQDHIIKSSWVICDKPSQELTPEDAAKTAFNERLLGMTHDFGDGRVIQVRPPETGKSDESNIRNAIDRMSRLNLAAEDWFMADNIFYPITAAELQAALESGQDQTAGAWAVLRDALRGGA